MRPALALVLVGMAISCQYSPPETVATPRAATTVDAPFDRVWLATVDVFAERNIPIRTMDRASGFISSDELNLSDPASSSVAWADCGTVDGEPVLPDKAVYNIRVRGDSTRTTVQVTVRWSGLVNLAMMGTIERKDCASKGTWEGQVELAIKTRAEG